MMNKTVKEIIEEIKNDTEFDGCKIRVLSMNIELNWEGKLEKIDEIRIASGEMSEEQIEKLKNRKIRTAERILSRKCSEMYISKDKKDVRLFV